MTGTNRENAVLEQVAKILNFSSDALAQVALPASCCAIDARLSRTAEWK